MPLTDFESFAVRAAWSSVSSCAWRSASIVSRIGGGPVLRERPEQVGARQRGHRPAVRAARAPVSRSSCHCSTPLLPFPEASTNPSSWLASVVSGSPPAVRVVAAPASAGGRCPAGGPTREPRATARLCSGVSCGSRISYWSDAFGELLAVADARLGRADRERDRELVEHGLGLGRLRRSGWATSRSRKCVWASGRAGAVEDVGADRVLLGRPGHDPLGLGSQDRRVDDLELAEAQAPPRCRTA